MKVFVRETPMGLEIITLILGRIKFAYGISAEILQTIVLWKFFWIFRYTNFFWVTEKYHKSAKSRQHFS